MLNQLNGIRARLVVLITTGLLLAPLAGLASAVLFGLIAAAELQSLRTFAILSGFVGLVTCLAGFHFSRYFHSPRAGLRATPASLSAPQQRQLARFSRDYWSFFLLYALATPALFFIALEKSIAAELGAFLQLLLLQLSVVAVSLKNGYRYQQVKLDAGSIGMDADLDTTFSGVYGGLMVRF